MQDKTINAEFYEFGKSCKFIAIGMIIGLLGSIAIVGVIIELIFIYKALKAIKEANYKLINEYLWQWRSKYIKAIILYFVGLILAIFLILSLFISGVIFELQLIHVILIVVIILVLIFTPSGLLGMKAWENMNKFFLENQNRFPSIIAQDAIKGTETLRTASKLRALGFLLVTIIIGYIMEIVGYFQLAHLKALEIDSAQETGVQPIQSGTIEVKPKQFCAHCGSPIMGDEKYCSSCGSEIK